MKYLSVQFDQRLRPSELPYFRSAVIEKTQRENDLFHNHRSSTAVIYRYPLIQYKLFQGRAGIVCLEDGTDAIHQLFRAQDLDLRIGRQIRNFRVQDMHLTHHDLRLTERPNRYYLRDYLPFNSQNFQRWTALAGDTHGQLDLLTGTLRGNLLALAKGIGWWIDGRVEVRPLHLYRVRTQPYKGQPMLCFDLSFMTNVVLPVGVGLGKGVSVGFGVLENLNDKK